MLVGFDTEYGYRALSQLANGRLRGDQTTMHPVCACLHFEDGRTLSVNDNYEQLQVLFDDPTLQFLVHGAHAEYGFCQLVGLQFPKHYRDTLLMGVLLVHATDFPTPGAAYRLASLASLTTRYGIPFHAANVKDEIRESIMRLRHDVDFGMERVLDYCLSDARATVDLYPRLLADLRDACGVNVERNLDELFQPFSLYMARVARRGLRFDQLAWDQLVNLAPKYRAKRLTVLRNYGYDHVGDGIGDRGFARLIAEVGLRTVWPRTATNR